MIYGAAVTEMDRQVGKLLTVLPPNTIVIFTSDNGRLLEFRRGPSAPRRSSSGRFAGAFSRWQGNSL